MTGDPISTIREALRVPPEGHHHRCNTRKTPPGECDCFMRAYTPALAALTEVEHQLAALGWGRDWQYDKAVGWRTRAVAAETALAEANQVMRDKDVTWNELLEAAERRANDLADALRQVEEMCSRPPGVCFARAALDRHTHQDTA